MKIHFTIFVGPQLIEQFLYFPNNLQSRHPQKVLNQSYNQGKCKYEYKSREPEKNFFFALIIRKLHFKDSKKNYSQDQEL